MSLTTSIMQHLSVIILLWVNLCGAEDSCNEMSKYMVRYKDTDKAYNQQFPTEPDEALEFCNGGSSCCTREIEQLFVSDLDKIYGERIFTKTVYINRLNEGYSRIEEYMTQVLTLTANVNQRTRALVQEYLDTPGAELAAIDALQYPQSVLLDMAEAFGVTGLHSDDCTREMMDILRSLGQLQINGLYVARLLYMAIPKGVEVLEQMKEQELSDDCVQELVKTHRCNFCLDSTKNNVRPCKDLCLAVTSVCYAHLAEVSSAWEEYAILTRQIMDTLDDFAKMYETGLSKSINQITTRLIDDKVKDTCGYSVASNLARHKRESDVPDSKIRKALFDEHFMFGMLGGLDEKLCGRSSTEGDKCWNGFSVGPYHGYVPLENNATVTRGLSSALASLQESNKEFQKVGSVKLEEIAAAIDDYNVVIATEMPVFDNDNGSAMKPTTFLSLILVLIPLTLH